MIVTQPIIVCIAPNEDKTETHGLGNLVSLKALSLYIMYKFSTVRD